LAAAADFPQWEGFAAFAAVRGVRGRELADRLLASIWGEVSTISQASAPNQLRRLMRSLRLTALPMRRPGR